ncbi:hypothetical protein Ahia01_001363800 [Argonauta hians]
MTENTAKDIILDIIGRLRSRKARPDLENICHMALRKHSLSSKETEMMMNKLVEENIVIRVTYKGRTSYRNAAKCSKTRMHAELLNKKAATKLRSAIQSQCSFKINNNNNNNNNSNNSSNGNGSSCSSGGTANTTTTTTSTINNTSTTNTTTTATTATAISNNNHNNNSHNNTKCGKHSRNSVICNNNNNNNNSSNNNNTNTNNNSSNNNSNINHSNNNSSTNNSSFCTTTTTTATSTTTTTTTTTDACSGGTCVHTGGEDPLTDNGDFTGLGTSPVKPENHNNNNNSQDLVTTQILNHNGGGGAGGAGSDDGCNGEGCSNGTGGGGGEDNGNSGGVGAGVGAGDGVGDDGDGVSDVAGVTREQIELWWHAQGFEPALAKIDLGAVIQNELLAKNIERLPSGYFVLTASGSTTTTTCSAFLDKVASLPPAANNTTPSSLSLLATAATTTTTSSTTATKLPTPTPTATNPLSPSSHQLPNNNNNNNDKNDCSSFASRPSTLKSNDSSPSVANQGSLPPHTATTTTTDTIPADTKRRADLVGSMNGVCGALTDAKGRQSFGKNCLPKPPCKRGRPVSRRKKFLKTLGPDFQSELPVAIHGISKCDFCLRPASVSCGRQGGDGEEGDDEELLCCKDCNTKAHPSCMNYSPELALRAYQSPWQCHTCRVCSVCNNDSGNALAMLICDSCDKGFHLHCLYPPPTRGLSGQWVCNMCSKQDNKDYDNSRVVSPTHQLVSIKNESCTYGPPTPSDSPEPTFPEMPQDFSRKRSVYDGPYPDVTEFSIEDVVRFFQSKGFTKEAAAFSEQEIDGKSLLLMKRDDVLVGLRDYICLGPALKIFKHVERLQWASE